MMLHSFDKNNMDYQNKLNKELGSDTHKIQSNRHQSDTRRRLMTRTETCTGKYNSSYHLVNNLYSKQNTFHTVMSTNSESQIRTKSRTKSSKSLFGSIKSTNYSQSKLKLHKKDNFVTPCSSNLTPPSGYRSLEDDTVKPNLIRVLEQKMNYKKQLKIKQQVENETIRRVIEQSNKKLQRNRIQSTYNLKLEQRKENLDKQHDAKKFNSLVSDFAQTQDQKYQKQYKKDSRKMIKTQVYNIQFAATSNLKESSYQNSPTSMSAQRDLYSMPDKIKEQSQSRDYQQIIEHKSVKPKQIQNKLQKNVQILSYSKVEEVYVPKQQKLSPKATDKNIQINMKKQVKIKQETEKKVQQSKPIPKADNIYNNQYDLEDLDSVNLTLYSKVNQSPNKKQVQEKVKPQEEEKRYKKAELERQKTKAKEKQRQREKKEEQQKDQIKRQKQIQKQRDQSIKQLSEANKIVDLITPLGQVAGYCAQLMKKSSLNWQTPAVLLYKECYQKFKSYEDIYKKCASIGIISQDDRDKFEEDNTLLQKNLEKVLKMGKKKQRISEEHQKIINCSQYININFLIQKQVIAFGVSALSSEQKMNKDVMMCLLRMINSVLILGMIFGREVKLIENIEEIQSSNRLQQIAVQRMIEIQPKKLKF